MKSAAAAVLPGVVVLMTWGEVGRVDNIEEGDPNTSEAPVHGRPPHNRPQLRTFLHKITL